MDGEKGEGGIDCRSHQGRSLEKDLFKSLYFFLIVAPHTSICDIETDRITNPFGIDCTTDNANDMDFRTQYNYSVNGD